MVVWAAILVGVGSIGGVLYYAAITTPSAAPRQVPPAPSATPSVARRDVSKRFVQMRPERSQSPKSTAVPATLEAAAPEQSAPVVQRIPEAPTEAPKPRGALKKPLTLDLNLSDDRQRHDLTKLESTSLTVAEIDGCDASYNIDASDSGKGVTTIKVQGVRDVIITVRLRPESTSAVRVDVSYSFINGSGNQDPLALANLGRLSRRIIKQGERADAVLTDLQSEQSRLQAWVAAPVAKALAARGQAKARILALDVEIREQAAAVQSFRNELNELEEFVSLVEHLHNDCAVVLAASE
jgi:hypothetical protein